jgi:outer membrane protein OmpA-like peptidoglycan-associated protein
MTFDKKSIAFFLLPAALLASACGASAPTQELVNARAAYDEAAHGPAASVAPDRLLEAKQALDKAEKIHLDDSQSREEKHYAYVAERVANLADTYAKTQQAERQAGQASTDVSKLQDSRRVQAESAATTANAQLGAEREARAKAEASLRSALASLLELASVKEESRGLVITLNGSVLFATGKSELLPAAKNKLDEVAAAIKDLKPGQTIVVEGHTDSVGDDASNQTLSQARAQSVRDYLASKGVPNDKVTAVGKGEGTPVADNKSPEGRANNRRVEIIVSPGGNSVVTSGK